MPQFDSSTLFLLAQAHGKESYLTWAIKAMGPFYSLALPILGLAVLGGAAAVVVISRRPGVIAAYLVFLPLPTLVGIYGTVQGLIAGFSEAAVGGADDISNAFEATVWATALFTTLVGMLVSLPSYGVIAIGLLVRAILWRGEKRP